MKKQILNITIIILISILVSIFLLNNKLYVLNDDGIQHIIRISEQTKCLKQGISSNVMTNLCNGFGYSWNIFYGQFTSMIPAIINLCVNSSVISFKIFLFIALLLSGISMYFTVLKITKNDKIALISAAFYMLVPYHLTDMYSRYSVAEFASFIFVPLVFLGLNSIINDEKDNNIFFIIGSIGLIITHLISTLITAIFGIIYLAINYKKLKNWKVIKSLIISIVFIITITSFFWAPMLEHMSNTRYAVFEDGIMSTKESVNNNRISILELLVTPKDKLNFQLGINIIILSILSIFVIKKIDKSYKKTYKIFLAFGIIAIIFSTKIINWNYMPKILLNIQFPWRMLEFAAFFLSIICAINFYYLIRKIFYIDIIFIIGISLILTITSLNIPLNKTKIEDPVPGKVNDLRINAGCAKYEYLPLKAYNNREYIKNRIDGICVLQGDLDIINEEKNNINYEATVESKTENTKLELPYIYYLGYNVKINGKQVNYTESENGFIQIQLEKNEKSKITLEYTGTSIMNISKILSLIGLIIFCIYIFLIIKFKSKNKLI